MILKKIQDIVLESAAFLKKQFEKREKGFYVREEGITVTIT